jgi:hypothetical protein
MHLVVAQAVVGVVFKVKVQVHLEQQIKVLLARIVLLIVILAVAVAALLIMPAVLLVEMALLLTLLKML